MQKNTTNETPGGLPGGLPGLDNPGYEQSDADLKFIFYVVVMLGVLTVVGLSVSWAVVEVKDIQRAKHPPEISPLVGTLPSEPPEPRLQKNPAADLRTYREAAEKPLHSYEWIDEKGGIVRIPIERAMDLIAERGLPVRGQAAAAPEKTQAKRQR